jgi:hypothetical protein
MTFHKIKYYPDGYAKRSYCSVCGAEGDQLYDKCGQTPIVKLPHSHTQKIIDDARDTLDSNYDNN